jgi:hypothetical protein
MAAAAPVAPESVAPESVAPESVAPEPVAPEPVLPADASAGKPAEAWVVDGYAHYHREGCPTLAGLPAEPLPLEEAVDLGFAPCAVCFADALRASTPVSTEPPAADEAQAVEPEALGHAQAPDEAAAAEAAPAEIPPIMAPGVGTPPAQTPPAEAPPAAAVEAEDTVWVVDGYLNYHRAGCTRIAGADAVAIPLEQATEDGFQPCAFCRPAAGVDHAEETLALEESVASGEFAAPPPPEATAAAVESDEVWVVDGHPNYHARGCATIAGQDAEPIPLSQALEDGFQRCPVCLTAAAEVAPPGEPITPDEAAAVADTATTQSQAAAESEREVLVVDGHPHYHEAGCAELVGEDVVPIPFSQATGDGFSPCPRCIGAATPATAEPEAPVGETVPPEAEPAAPPTSEPVAAPVSETVAEPVAVPASEPVAEAAQPEAAQPEAAQPEAARPEAVAAPSDVVTEPEPAAQAVQEVWVLEGRPRYHRRDCLIIKGQQAQAMSSAQAEAAGFHPCSLCNVAAH